MNVRRIFFILLIICCIFSTLMIFYEKSIQQLWVRTVGKITNLTCGREFTARDCHASTTMNSTSERNKDTYQYCNPIFQKNCNVDVEYVVKGDTYTNQHFKTYKHRNYPQIDDI